MIRDAYMVYHQNTWSMEALIYDKGYLHGIPPEYMKYGSINIW